MGFMADLFEKHKFIRRSGMIACMALNILIVLATLYAFLKGNQLMSDNTRLVLLGAFGLNSVYIGLYQWDRMQDR